MNENTRHKTLAGAAASTWDAFVIVVGMLKGGTGKTTSAWFIALYYAVVLGLPTLLLDADAAGQSAYDWFKVAQAAGFDIPANLVVERYPFDDLASGWPRSLRSPGTALPQPVAARIRADQNGCRRWRARTPPRSDHQRAGCLCDRTAITPFLTQAISL
ncbi:hypothetical protein [Streptomyces chartreusis]